MTDLVVPVLVGSAAALLPFLVHWYWERRRDSTGGLGTSLVDAVHEWTRRIKPAAPDPNLVIGPSAMPPPSIRPAVPWMPEHLPPVVDEAAPSTSGETAGAGRPAPRMATSVPHAAEPTSAATPPAGRSVHGTQRPVPGIGSPEGPATKSARRPRPARGRSTIQLDPLEAPVDSRRARVTVGALIDDLERAKLSRPT